MRDATTIDKSVSGLKTSAAAERKSGNIRISVSKPDASAAAAKKMASKVPVNSCASITAATARHYAA